MHSAHTDGHTRRLVSTGIPLMLIAASFAVMVGLAIDPLANYDTFFHLAIGAHFLNDWSLQDPGTLTPVATAQWVPTQWLPEMAMAQFEEWFGLAGVAALFGAALVLLALTLVVTARSFVDLPVASPLVALGILGCASGLSARPQVISYILVGCVAFGWLRSVSSGKLPWWIIPVTWLWTMCHGMWPLGILISIVAAVGLALDKHPRSRRGVPFLIPLGSAVAAASTPLGLDAYGAVRAVSQRSHFYGEWDTPGLFEPPVLATLVICAIAVVWLCRSGKPAPWLLIGLTGSCLIMAVYSGRTVPVAAAVGVPLTAFIVSGGSPRSPLTRRVLGGYLAIAGFAVALIGVVVPTTASEPAPQPAELESILDSLPAGTRIVTDTGFGSFMTWRYPDLEPTDMGYGDQYTLDELERTERIVLLDPGWDDDLANLKSQYALVPADSPLAYSLSRHLAWSTVFENDDVVLLGAPEGG